MAVFERLLQTKQITVKIFMLVLELWGARLEHRLDLAKERSVVNEPVKLELWAVVKVDDRSASGYNTLYA
jgi:hypothetical protein